MGEKKVRDMALKNRAESELRMSVSLVIANFPAKSCERMGWRSIGKKYKGAKATDAGIALGGCV